MSAAKDLFARRSLHWASWVVLYTLAAVLGRATIVEGSQLALVWPAAGIGFAWVLWALRRQGLAAARAAVLGVAVLTSAVAAVAGVAVSIAVAFGVAHGLLVAVGVWVLVRAGGPRVAMLQTPRDLWVLLLAAVSGSVASAAVGPTAVILLAADTPAAYGLWVVRNAVSVILVLACALAVRHPVRDQQSPGSRAELVAAAVAAVVGYALVFAPANGLPVAFAVLSVSVWAGLRFDKQVAAVFAAGGGAAVVLATINDRGAFADIGGSAGIVIAQAFIATVTLVTLVLALQREVQARLAHHLTMSEERFRSAFEAAPVCMLMAPLEAGGRLGPVVRTNSDLSTFVGRSVEELLGSRVELLVDEQDRPVFSHLVEHLCSPDGAERVELRFRHADGGTVWGVVSLARISVEGADATVLCLVEDVTARKAAEAALTRQALHDNLTGLPNRTLLADRLGRATRVPDGTRAGLIYLDLDGFKLHNDHLGHSGGDELLARVGGRIAGCVGTIDTVARLGGDEYAVLCEDLSTQAELEGIADRIRATLTEPLHVAGSAVMVQASIGMVLAEPEEAAESVLRRAERAMSAVKHGGRPGSSLVSPEQARAARTLRLLPELERAVADDEFVMFGQPVVDVATGRIVAVETLVRWRHPQRGLLPPSEFLDVLEGSSLMSEAGIQILGKSLRMARDWYDVLGHEAPLVHVNVSGAQLQDGHLSEALRAAQAAAGVPMSQIVLELTETHAPLISDSLLSDVGALRRDGVRIALDDLGTGYSSLQRITELPTDILKIDRRFVAGLGSDPRCSAIVRGVLSMSQALGLSVIAEGVETEEQHELLRQHDCDTAQGYLYARPMPADELLETLVGTRSLLPR